MKKKRAFSLAILSVISIFCVALIVKVCTDHKNTATIISERIEIISATNQPGNNRQHEADVWLGCYDKKLYYFGGRKNTADKLKNDNSLCVFQDGSLVEVFPLSKGKGIITILGIVESNLYYLDYDNKKLYCYNLKSNEETLLQTGSFDPASSQYYAEDGSVYFPLSPEHGEVPYFVHVLGESALGIEPLTEGYSLGESIYYVVKEYSDGQVERILKSNPNAPQLEELTFDQAYKRSVIPYDGGLLVHNEGLNELLYRINSDGSITNLFSVPCLASISAVNVHGTDAYLSVLRYEKYGEWGRLRYENDTMKGTYRINLIDGSVEKINDMFFNGIYNFGDDDFYCCDEQGNIYRMELDGTLRSILLISKNG